MLFVPEAFLLIYFQCGTALFSQSDVLSHITQDKSCENQTKFSCRTLAFGVNVT